MAKITINKSKEYGFKLEVNQTLELDDSNEPEYCYNILFIDTQTNETVEYVYMTKYSLCFEKKDIPVFCIRRSIRNVYDAVYKKLEKANPQVAKKINDDIYLSINSNDYNTLVKAYEIEVEKLKEKYLQEFYKKGILLKYYPDKVYSDGITIYLHDNYILHNDNINLLNFLFKLNGRNISWKVYYYCDINNLFNIEEIKTQSGIMRVKSVLLTQELLEKATANLTENERKQAEKKLTYLKNLLSDRNKLLEHVFTDEVHVTEDGYFSECDRFCDDCFWFKYIVKPYYNDVRDITNTFIIKGNNGKSYTYYKPNSDALKILETKYQNEVTKTIEKITNEIKKIKEVLK